MKKKYEFEKNTTKWGTIVLLGMSERKSSISYTGHTQNQQTIWNTKKSKKQRYPSCTVVQNAQYILHTMALNAPTQIMF